MIKPRSILLLSLLMICTSPGAQVLEVRARAILSGAYTSGGMMSTYINNSGYLPLLQPYTGWPWSYQGMESLDSVPVNMVDWVLVELRDQQNIVRGRRSAILMRDGSICDTNMQSYIRFPGLSQGNYYMVIDHRNHLPVMSALPVTFPTQGIYDFTDTLNYPPFGGGKYALQELAGGISGLIVGDINKDGIVKFSGPGNDRGLIIQRIIQEGGTTAINATVDGYYPEDITMDGTVKYSGPGNDPSLIIQTIVGMTSSTAVVGYYSTPTPCPPPDTADAGPDSLNIPGDSIYLYANTL